MIPMTAAISLLLIMDSTPDNLDWFDSAVPSVSMRCDGCLWNCRIRSHDGGNEIRFD